MVLSGVYRKCSVVVISLISNEPPKCDVVLAVLRKHVGNNRHTVVGQNPS